MNADDRGREQERLDAHVDHAGEDAGRAGREWIVLSTRWPGEAGLDGDVGRLGVADLADHDDLRVLPHERTQGDGIGVFPGRIALGLGDERQVELHRILDRGHADARPGTVDDDGAGRRRWPSSCPEPVGPVSKIRPVGLARAWPLMVDERVVLDAQPVEVEAAAACGSKMRMTTFSPRMVGKVEMRSTTLPASSKVFARPSCGRLVSCPMRLAMILRRPTTLGCRSLGRWTSSLSTPLRRTRTAIELSQGSIWISDAPARTASTTTQSTSFTMSMSSSEVHDWRNWTVLELMRAWVYTGERKR